jgi:L-fucose dehydrogenase
LITMDLSTPETCQQAVEQTVEKFGRMDELMNNAVQTTRLGWNRERPATISPSLNRNLVHYYCNGALRAAAFETIQGFDREHSLEDGSHRPGKYLRVRFSKGAIMALTREWAVELLPTGCS